MQQIGEGDGQERGCTWGEVVLPLHVRKFKMQIRQQPRLRSPHCVSKGRARAEMRTIRGAMRGDGARWCLSRAYPGRTDGSV